MFKPTEKWTSANGDARWGRPKSSGTGKKGKGSQTASSNRVTGSSPKKVKSSRSKTRPGGRSQYKNPIMVAANGERSTASGDFTNYHSKAPSPTLFENLTDQQVLALDALIDTHLKELNHSYKYGVVPARTRDHSEKMGAERP